MKTKHTPGEWYLEDRSTDELGNSIIVRSNNNHIKLTECFDGNTERNEANAKLIAAAPETTELGIETRDLLYDYFDSLPDQLKPLLNKWRKAIKKATD